MLYTQPSRRMAAMLLLLLLYTISVAALIGCAPAPCSSHAGGGAPVTLVLAPACAGPPTITPSPR